MATDSIYVRKSALKKLERVEAFMPMKKCDCSGVPVRSLFARERVPSRRSSLPNGMMRTRSSTCPGWVVGWCDGALPVPGRPTILITVGQGPIALAVGVGGDGLDIFTLNYPFFSFPFSFGDGPI